MTSQPHSVPPTVAVWLLRLFAIGNEGESILGDLFEEFLSVARQSGARSARRWFWRQTLKTIPRLASFGFRTAPRITLSAVAVGFLLRKVIGPAIGPVTFAILEKFQPFFEHHLSLYIFFASTGLDIQHLLTFLLIGFFVALAARGREMVATTMLAFIFGTLAVVGCTYAAFRTGDGALLWRLAWYFSDCLATVGAGAVVRMHRLAPKSRRAAA